VRKGDEVAADVLFEQVILEMVPLFRHAPRLSATMTTVAVVESASDVPGFSVIDTEDVFVRALKDFGGDPGNRAQLLGLIDGNITSRPPKVYATVFYGGVKFHLSIVDATIIEHLAELVKLQKTPGKPMREVRGNGQTAFADAFRIRVRYVHCFTPTVKEPQPTESSPLWTRKKLEERKVYREFLLARSDGIEHFDTVIDSATNLISLQCRALATAYMSLGRDCAPPARFVTTQHREYAMHLTTQFLPEPVWKRIASMMQGDFVQTYGDELERRISAEIAKGSPPAEAILNGACDYVNEWKARLYPDYPNGAASPTTPNDQIDRPLAALFATAVDEMGLAMAFADLTEKVNVPQCDKLARSSSKELPKGAGHDPAVLAVLEFETELQFLVARAGQAIKTVREFEIEDWEHGNRVLLFLEIEKLLSRILEADGGGTGPSEWRDSVIAGLFGEEDPLYLRASLAECMEIVRRARKQGGAGQRLAGIGRLFAPMEDPLKRLAIWFGLKETGE
jgi:hypothetical protein